MPLGAQGSFGTPRNYTHKHQVGLIQVKPGHLGKIEGGGRALFRIRVLVQGHPLWSFGKIDGPGKWNETNLNQRHMVMVKIQIAPLVNIRFNPTTKIGSKMGGEFTETPKWDTKTVLTTTTIYFCYAQLLECPSIVHRSSFIRQMKTPSSAVPCTTTQR